MAVSKARGYAYAKIEYVSVRTYLSKIEYAYDTFRTLNSIHPESQTYRKRSFTRLLYVQLYRLIDTIKENRVTKFNQIDILHQRVGQ